MTVFTQSGLFNHWTSVQPRHQIILPVFQLQDLLCVLSELLGDQLLGC